VPPDVESLHTFINRHQNRYKYRDQGIDRNLLRCMKAYYYAAISFVDFQIGRILEALAETGQLENTIVLHTADHGEHLGDYNCFGKRSMHDSCARIPMIAAGAGRFAPGTVCPTPVSLVDIAPTVLGAAGAGFTDHDTDGLDLADVARGDCEREMVFSQLSFQSRGTPEQRAAGSTYMAVSREWKYFYSAPDDREYLFDRATDPLETRNRAGLPFCGSDARAMRDALMDHLRSGGETAGIDGDRWRSFPKLEVPANPDAGLLIQDHPWADTAIPGYTDPK
jgi:arylsulfatase A-like enzyme